MSRYQHRRLLDREQSVIGLTAMYDTERGAVQLSAYGNKIMLSAQESLDLLTWLGTLEPVLQDQANNYYDCRECGERHPKSVIVCPTLLTKDDGHWE